MDMDLAEKIFNYADSKMKLPTAEQIGADQREFDDCKIEMMVLGILNPCTAIRGGYDPVNGNKTETVGVVMANYLAFKNYKEKLLKQ